MSSGDASMTESDAELFQKVAEKLV